MFARTPEGSAAGRVMAGLALLTMIAAGCGVTAEGETGALADVSSGSGAALDDAPEAALEPYPSGDDPLTAA